MITSRKTTSIASIAVIIIAVVTTYLYFYPITALTKLDRKQVASVVYVGAEDKILYYYPEDAAKELVEVLKNSKLKGFPTNQSGKYVGEGPMLPTVIIFEDNSILRASYLFAVDIIYLIVDGKWYSCDRQTLEKFREIERECYNAYKSTWSNQG